VVLSLAVLSFWSCESSTSFAGAFRSVCVRGRGYKYAASVGFGSGAHFLVENRWMIQGVRPHSDSSGLAVLVDFWRGCREVQEEAQGLHAPGSNGVLPGPCPP
jgi:hypothetical protein